MWTGEWLPAGQTSPVRQQVVAAVSDYVVELCNLIKVKSSGSAIGPLFLHLSLPGPEEFYNGPRERASNPPDDPMDAVDLRIGGGETLKGIDIHCNEQTAPAASPTLRLFEIREDALTPAAKRQIYTIRGSRGGQLTFEMSGKPGSSLAHPQLEITDSAGTLIKKVCGWIKIESDHAAGVSGSVTFGTRDGNSLTTLPLSATLLKEAVIPHIAQNQQYFTGVALLNTGARAANIHLQAFDGNGAVIGSAQVTLALGQRICRLFRELWPSLNNLTGG